MPDLVDHANELVEAFLESKLAAKRRSSGEAAQRPSAINCTACAEKIPKARRESVPGVQLCLGCQAAREKRR